jgi:hypothetical protein
MAESPGRLRAQPGADVTAELYDDDDDEQQDAYYAFRAAALLLTRRWQRAAQRAAASYSGLLLHISTSATLKLFRRQTIQFKLVILAPFRHLENVWYSISF